MNRIVLLLACILSFLPACQQVAEQGTFANDLEILANLDDLTLLENGQAMIAVSPVCQGRVFTSTSGGMNGRSLGYFNRELIGEGDYKNKMSSLCGEGRMWFGPEIGKFSIFFDPGMEQVAENIRISPDLDKLEFELLDQTESSVTSGNSMKIRNAAGYIFNIYARRQISLKSIAEIEHDLGISLDENVSTVAFSAGTRIRNEGERQWKKETGLLSIWELGCMLPSEEAVVIIPVKGNFDSATVYFTPVDESRIRIKDGLVFYRADAGYMNKIGIQPEYCREVFGSYSPELNLLSIVKYSFHHDSLYVNSLWGHEMPYRGDVINIFNGEINESLGRNWPFFEFESSSSARELKPGEEMEHMQSIYHFEGDAADLEEISLRVLGVSLDDIRFLWNK